jgi:hypothetical protein
VKAQVASDFKMKQLTHRLGGLSYAIQYKLVAALFLLLVKLLQSSIHSLKHILIIAVKFLGDRFVG